ncbi:MAG: DNA polymerase III subunit beta, partial [Gammaproteobacteria bacterium]|nr:DNA polymerase III subunit beta [Gammaproteobacteria bacterium]
MKFQITKEDLLHPLQQVSGVVERRQTLPILSNVLVVADGDGIAFTATDLEVELHARLPHDVITQGSATLPARKLMDICRNLPDGAEVTLEVVDERGTLRSGRSQFKLATLPVEDFPKVEEVASTQTVELPQAKLRRLIDATHFAMAQQDVRYYLNGLMIELAGSRLRAVATDGHRLSLADIDAELKVDDPVQVIVPRKGITELLRLLDESEEPARIDLGSNHVRVSLPGITFTSKLIDGRFPDYERVIPADSDHPILADCHVLRQALLRTSILSNEKYRGIRFQLETDNLRILAHNPEQEEAEEEIEVRYGGEPIEIGFN